MDSDNTKGREENDAGPLGARPGVVSERETMRIGKKEAKSAGPDGPDATAVGDTFKTQR